MMRVWRMISRLCCLALVMAGVHLVWNVALPAMRRERQLFMACSKADADQVEALLRSGVRVNARNRFGETPLVVALTARFHSSITSMLIEAGADVEATDRWKEPALILALRKGDSQVARQLIAKGASVHVRDRNSTPALILAFDQRCSDLVPLMLDRGADPKAVGLDGRTALMLAMAYGDTIGSPGWVVNLDGRERWVSHREFVTLMSAGAGKKARARPRSMNKSILPRILPVGTDVNARDGSGHTALMWATASGKIALVKQCLQMGADPGAEDVDGDSALDRAEGAGFEDIAALLRKHGAR